MIALRLFGRTPLAVRLLRRSLAVPLAAACVLTGAAAVSLPSASTAAAAAAAATRSPIGGVDLMNRTAGGLWARGWVFDPDTPTTPTTVDGWVDGKDTRSFVLANLSRPDVARSYPRAGAAHGFSWRIPVPEGRHTVCLRATNLGRGGASRYLQCRTTTFDYGPAAALETATAVRGALHVRGWAIDGDAWTTPLAVRLTVDGVRSTIVANQPRADVATTYPNTGTLHGFDTSIPVAQGVHTVCATVTNIGYGSDTALGCHTVYLDDRPIGGLNTPYVTSGKLRIYGWTFDRDAPTTSLTATITVDSARPVTLLANLSRPDVAKVVPGIGDAHGFDLSVTLPEGTHTVCGVLHNIGFGSDRAFPCKTAVVDFTPRAAVTIVRPTTTGLVLAGWAYDPDTSAPVSTNILLDGRTVATVTASRKGNPYSGHDFDASVSTTSGRHTVCAVAVNVLYGTRNSAPACQPVTLALGPLGYFDSVARVGASTNLLVTGWAGDPDTTAALTVTATVDGHAVPALRAGGIRTDVGAVYPSLGSMHGLSAVLAADSGEHRVCLTAVNVGGGSDKPLGCKTVNAVHPVVAAAPRAVSVLAGYGGATLSWAPPVFDGGTPVTGFTITTNRGDATVTVPGGTTSAVVVGLRSDTYYRFTVQAVNGVGSSPGAASTVVRTDAGPPAQRTPAPISTSRYIRNVRGSSPSDLAMMRAEGATDAAHNPSGHGYLVLLDIGGQDADNGGVVLSAGVRFVSYYDLVRDIQAYLDGYASAQRASAPVVVAVGTNNDLDVSAATGRVWAATVVNPLVAYARRYIGMTVAGADDIEPGFRASYGATQNWLSGYLAATSAPFVFNGSADGCAWTTTNRRCNNGWTMAGLHYLASGAAPTRMLNLPQIYNNTMADQWKFISLTGVVNHLPRINFAGVLTEATACAQAGGCGSMSGRSAWTRMWNDLQSDARLKVSSLPYATDLRIDR